MQVPSLKRTAKAPENGWLEDDAFLLGPGQFSGVCFREGKSGNIDIFRVS